MDLEAPESDMTRCVEELVEWITAFVKYTGVASNVFNAVKTHGVGRVGRGRGRVEIGLIGIDEGADVGRVGADGGRGVSM
jgi:hypothetical protein